MSLFESAKKAVDPRVRYLAFLFAGSILERRSQFAEAEEQYRQGVAEYPWGQSGHLALAEVMSRTGRDGDARATLLARFNGAQRIVEPLWTYAFARPEDQLAALFDELRVEVGK
jgi:predicted Zn-dependent protease